MNPARWTAAGQLALAFAAGATSVTAFAPFSLGLVAPIALAVLIFLWRNPARDGLSPWLGFAYGLGLMGFGVFWIRISIAQFGGVPILGAIAITLSFIVLIASFYAFAGWVVARLRPRLPEALWLIAVVPAVWVLLEWLRGWLFTGFPWLVLGYSQIELPTASYAALFGVYGVSLVVVFTASLLNLLPRLMAVLTLCLLWGGGVALQQVNWSQTAGDTFRVSLLQGNVPQHAKWSAELREPTLKLYLSMTESVAQSKLVVWPETAVPAFASTVETSLLAPLDAQMVKEKRDVLLGIVDGDPRGDYYNAMLSLGISGREHYYKQHLVPFGEYLPFDRWTRPVLDFLQIPMSDFTAGERRKPLVTLAGYPAGIDICYEDAFGEEIIRALPEAAFLINASNDAWFGDSLAPHQHLEIARMRAVETARYLLRATNTGISAIIDEHGGVLARSAQFERAVLTAPVSPMLGLTPYARWGNLAFLAITALLLLPVLLVQRRDR